MKQNNQQKQIEKDFAKVIGYEPIKLVLERILDMVRNREKYEKLGCKWPSGILLKGRPGVGKTLLANSFIEASGLPVYLVRKDQPDGEFVKFIKQSFEDAKNHAPAIVFLDDMDKFANSDDRHRDTEEYVTIQSCIDDVKGKNVIVIATVNTMDKLPLSLCRVGRFDEQIVVETPNRKDAARIIEHYLKQKAMLGDIDNVEIARILTGCSCVGLENVINKAAMYAGYAGKEKIEKEDLLRSAMCVIFGAPKLIEKRPDKILRKIAYHEAGHVVAAETLEKESVSLVSVLGHDSSTQGITVYYQDDDEYFSNINLMKSRVKALLAGRAATEIIYGEVDVGANSDLHRAFDIVERFVDHYCGFGFDKFEFNRSSSNNLLNRKESQVANELEHYYQEARQILIDNRKFLDQVAQALFEKETLTAKDIQAIKKTCQEPSVSDKILASLKNM